MEQPPLITREQQAQCDELLGFAIHCQNSATKRPFGSHSEDNPHGQTKGQRPLTFAAFREAVQERMPEKTDQEKLYLLTYGAQYLHIE